MVSKISDFRILAPSGRQGAFHATWEQPFRTSLHTNLLAVASDLRPLLLLMLVASRILRKEVAATDSTARIRRVRLLNDDLDVEAVDVEGPSASAAAAAAVVALLLRDGARAQEVAVRDCQKLPATRW